jgi:hypothetical protein
MPERCVVNVPGKVESFLQAPAGRIVGHERQFKQNCGGLFEHDQNYRKNTRWRILPLNQFRGLLRLGLSIP